MLIYKEHVISGKEFVNGLIMQWLKGVDFPIGESWILFSSEGHKRAIFLFHFLKTY